jgi:hypothetical protein
MRGGRAGARANVIQMLWGKGLRGVHLCTVCARDFVQRGFLGLKAVVRGSPLKRAAGERGWWWWWRGAYPWLEAMG